MLPFAMQRLTQAVFALLGVSFVVFLSLYLAPGDPALLLAGPQAESSQVEAIRERYRLGDPLILQYTTWLSRVIQGDLGTSFRGGRSVWSDVARAYPISLTLASIALLLAITVGIPAGVLAATRRNTAVDFGIMAGAVAGISIPTFWLALMLVLLFSLELRILPSSGWGTVRHAVLPVFCLSLSSLALIARMTRAVMVETLAQDFVRTARAKGLGEPRIRYGHALANALLPIITIVGLRFGLLAGGAVIIETVFAIPGMGTMIVRGVSARDFPVVQGGVLIIALTISLVNLLVDLLYAALDPRIRYT